MIAWSVMVNVIGEPAAGVDPSGAFHDTAMDATNVAPFGNDSDECVVIG